MPYTTYKEVLFGSRSDIDALWALRTLNSSTTIEKLRCKNYETILFDSRNDVDTLWELRKINSYSKIPLVHPTKPKPSHV